MCAHTIRGRQIPYFGAELMNTLWVLLRRIKTQMETVIRSLEHEQEKLQIDFVAEIYASREI